MKSLTKRLFLYAFLFSIIAVGALYMYLKSFEEEKVVEPKTVQILVAAQDIPARTLITSDMIKKVEVPEEADFTTFLNDEDDIVDKYTKEAIYQNERFHSEKLIEDARDELSLVIEGDHRALTLMVDLSAGVADLIKPGDFVDVLVFLPEIKEADRIVRPNIVKMIQQNLQVLAIDQNLYRDAEEQAVELPSTFYVTLSVPVVDVEGLVLAMDIGSITLALRPFEKDYIHETDGVIWEELLLDDQFQMKDIFPTYEIKGQEEGSAPVTQDYDKYIYYTIEFGDTLRSISMKFYGTEEYYTLLQQVNKISDVDSIVTGTGIKIPVLAEVGESNEQN